MNCKKKKCHGNLDSVTFQQKSHENFNEKINFEITRNNRNITFIIKKIKNPHLNSESLSSLKICKLRLALSNSLRKPIYIGMDLQLKLASPTATNVKSISSHCRQFQMTIFLN